MLYNVDSAFNHTTSWLHAELSTDKTFAYLSHSKMGNTQKSASRFLSANTYAVC